MHLSDRVTLECPCCGGENLHHAATSIAMRKEDAEMGTSVHTEFENQSVHMFKDINFIKEFTRRDGMCIQFTCETCNGEPELMIYQNKGSTFMEWANV